MEKDTVSVNLESAATKNFTSIVANLIQQLNCPVLYKPACVVIYLRGCLINVFDPTGTSSFSFELLIGNDSFDYVGKCFFNKNGW